MFLIESRTWALVESSYEKKVFACLVQRPHFSHQLLPSSHFSQVLDLYFKIKHYHQLSTIFIQQVLQQVSSHIANVAMNDNNMTVPTTTTPATSTSPQDDFLVKAGLAQMLKGSAGSTRTRTQLWLGAVLTPFRFC
jgi:hypothetical protein